VSSTKPSVREASGACQPILRMDSDGDIYSTNGELIVARKLSLSLSRLIVALRMLGCSNPGERIEPNQHSWYTVDADWCSCFPGTYSSWGDSPDSSPFCQRSCTPNPERGRRCDLASRFCPSFLERECPLPFPRRSPLPDLGQSIGRSGRYKNNNGLSQLSVQHRLPCLARDGYGLARVRTQMGQPDRPGHSPRRCRN
jgi:hypothetical protein